MLTLYSVIKMEYRPPVQVLELIFYLFTSTPSTTKKLDV